jgi:glucosylceramidase
MNWNGDGLAYFTKNNLLPALHAANLSTKVLALDWNWDTYTGFAAATMNDAAIRTDSLFGGMAWHGYGGDVSQQTTVHNQYPSVNAYSTEHSGGTWVSNQQAEDMNNIVDYTRNWSKSFVKWSLAVDQNMGPHNQGCGTCTGFITVHNGDSDRAGRLHRRVLHDRPPHEVREAGPRATRLWAGSTRSPRPKSPCRYRHYPTDPDPAGVLDGAGGCNGSTACMPRPRSPTEQCGRRARPRQRRARPATVTDGALPIVATIPELPEVMNSAIGQGRNFDQGT